MRYVMEFPVQRIEISPLFKLAQNRDSKYINPLVKIFKVNDNNAHEHMFIPINSEHVNRDRYEKHEVNKSNFIPESNVAFLVSPTPIHKKLSPELHKFDYVF